MRQKVVTDQTILNNFDVLADGTISIRFVKQIIDDSGRVLASEWHRTSIEPGMDAEKQLQFVDEHLTGIGREPVSDGKEKLRPIIDLIHTPQVIEAHKARKEAWLKARFPQENK